MSIHARFHCNFGGFSLDVDQTLPGQGVSVLFGPSGSGKTTLLRCLAGLERVSGGRLEVNGDLWQDDARQIFVPTHRRPLGLVFQEASLFPHLSVRGNLEFGWKRVSAAERQVEFAQAIELLGIGALLERRPGKLSGGERQRVAIARALLTSPKLLLMDEPLAALDFKRKLEIMPYLERLHDELSIPVVYVSHSREEVARLGDTLVVLAEGRIVDVGPMAQVLPRLEPPFDADSEAATVVEARVAAHEPSYGLSRVDFRGGALWIGQVGKPVGAPVRVRIPARDVSVALVEPRQSSILNILPATVLAVEDDGTSRSLVRLAVGDAQLAALLTRKSAAGLALAAGARVYAQIKGVSLLR